MADEHPGPDDQTAKVGRPRGPGARAPTPTTGPSRYSLLEPLGRGGGGVVYAAHDRELDRRVAIKLVRATAATAPDETGSQARLLREAQAMARLAHPNVIHVYDVAPYEPGELTPAWPELAEADELPAERGVFVVMELVEGDTLTEWLHAGPHPWRDVLDVMIPAGRGLIAAHSQGLVHRDFKPGNVLLGEDGRPRVLDFGLARAAAEEWSDSGALPSTSSRRIEPLESPLTQTGTVLGTPAYMAPEQHRGDEATEAADQYAFCIVLYEALCGRRPFRGTSLRELRVKKEAGKIAAPPDGVHVPTWLWRVVTRGLSVDPGHRFGSMQAVVDELDAVPRARRRRRIVAAVAAAVALGVGVGAVGWLGARSNMCADRSTELAGIWDDQARARIEAAFMASDKPYAADAWSNVSGRVDAYAARWLGLREQVCRDTHVDGTQTVEIMHWRDQCLLGARAALDELVAQWTAADASAVEHAVAAAADLPAIDRCASPDIAEAELARDESTRDRRAQLSGELARAKALLTMAKYEAADQRASEVLAAAEAEGLADIAAQARIEIGLIAIRTDDQDRAEEQMQTALRTAEEAGADEAAIEASVHLIRIVGVLRERHDEAARIADHAGARLKHRGRDDALMAEYHRSVGALREKQGKFPDALAHFERSLEIRSGLFEPNDPLVAQSTGAVGLALFRMGKYREANETLHKALALYGETVGEAHPLAAKMKQRIAVNAAGSGKLDVAVEVARDALDTLEAALGPEHIDVLNTMHNLAVILHNSGDDEAALPYIERSLALQAKVQGTRHPEYGKKLGNLALIFRAMGRVDEAIAALEQQLALFEEVYEPTHVNLGYAHLNLSSVYQTAERFEEALPHSKRALEIWQAAYGPDHDSVATAWSLLCGVEQELGHKDKARAACQRALDIYENLRKHEDFEDLPLLGGVTFRLAWMLPASRRDEAIALAMRSREAFATGNKKSDLEEVEKWLRKRGVKLEPIAMGKPPG